MQGFELSISVRTGLGKGEVGRLRSAGSIPAVVYSAGENSWPAAVPTREFTTLAQKASRSQLFTLKCTSGELNGKLALVKDVQRHPVDGKVIHVDFLALREDQEITLSVPIHLHGEAPGVKTDGGVLSIAHHDIEISCLPRAIPQSVIVDISNLGMHQTLHAGEIPLPEGVKLAMDDDEALVSVVEVRQAVEAAPAVAATAADGTAAPASEGGEATAAGASSDAEKPASDKKK